MGLFDKKYCDICNEKIGLLGNRKLSDGNLCKDCAAKLSPWFSERRESSVEEIRGQLEYREANKQAVAAFNITSTFGTNTKVYLDEDHQKFMVTSAKNIATANPDVMDYSQITGCRVDVQDRSYELKQRDSQGNEVSYSPPQYAYEYDFYIVININHPYFNEIRFKLNNNDITVKPDIRMAPGQPGRVASAPAMRGATAPSRPAGPTGMQSMASMMRGSTAPGKPSGAPAMRGSTAPNRAVGGATPAQPARPMQQMATRVMGSSQVDPYTNPEYVRYENMAYDICNALLGVHDYAREQAEAANIPQQAVTCPWCGATTLPDANGCCEYCGGAVNG